MSQGGEDWQLQYVLEERTRLLRHLTSFPSRKNVGESYIYILKSIIKGKLNLHFKSYLFYS